MQELLNKRIAILKDHLARLKRENEAIASEMPRFSLDREVAKARASALDTAMELAEHYRTHEKFR